MYDSLFGLEPMSEFIGNAFMAARAGHPVMREMLDLMARNFKFKAEGNTAFYSAAIVNEADPFHTILQTGTCVTTVAFFNKAGAGGNRDFIAPPEMFYPSDSSERPEFGIPGIDESIDIGAATHHLWCTTWKGECKDRDADIHFTLSDKLSTTQTISSINNLLKVQQPKSVLVKNPFSHPVTLKVFDFYHPEFEENDFAEDMAIIFIPENKYRVLSVKERGEDDNGGITGKIVPHTYIRPYREKTETNATVLISHETIQPRSEKKIKAADQLAYLGRLLFETENVGLIIQ